MAEETLVARFCATTGQSTSTGNFGMQGGVAGTCPRSLPLFIVFLTRVLIPIRRYRNFLMVCTALMDQPFQPMYFPLLDSPTSPGVRNLQHWIEDAWRCGALL
jgi:hypothetical protein